MIIELANEQKKIINTIFFENYLERIELITNFLFEKEADIDIMVNMDKKHYETVFNYCNFILENFCDIEEIDNLYKEHYEKKENIYLKILSLEEIENKVFTLIYKVLFYIKKIKIIYDNQNSKRFFFTLTKKIFALLEYLNKNSNNAKSENKLKPKIYGKNKIKPDNTNDNNESLNWLFETEIDFSNFTYEELTENFINNNDIFKADNRIKVIFVFYFFVNLKNKENVEKIYICEIYKIFFDFFINMKENYNQTECLQTSNNSEYYEANNMNKIKSDSIGNNDFSNEIKSRSLNEINIHRMDIEDKVIFYINLLIIKYIQL